MPESIKLSTSDGGGLARTWLQVFNRQLHRLDRHFHTAQSSEHAPIFIIGAPRSGTTLTYQIVSQQLVCTYFPRLTQYFYGLSNINQRLLKPLLQRPTPEFQSNYGRIRGCLAPSEYSGYWSLWLPVDDPSDHYMLKYSGTQLLSYQPLQDSLDSLMTIAERPVLVKCLYLVPFVDLLARLFPRSHFIVVRRRRLQTAQSLLMARRRRADPHTWWSLKIPGYRELLDKPLEQQVSEQLVFTENFIQQALRPYAARVNTIDYEALCQDPRCILEQLGEWLSDQPVRWHHSMRVPRQFLLSQQIRLPPPEVASLEAALDAATFRHKQNHHERSA